MLLKDVVINKRKEKGLSRRAVAELAGFTEATLRKIETGVTANPSIGVINGLATALCVPASELATLANHGMMLGNVPVSLESVKRQAMTLSKADRVKLVQKIVEEL